MEGCGVWFCSAGCKEKWSLDFRKERVWKDVERRIRSMSFDCDDEEEEPKAEDITQEFMDCAWSKASKLPTPRNLTELEADTARFVLSALLSTTTMSSCTELQSHELEHTKRNPWILASHIRIYSFVQSVLNETDDKKVREILSRDHGNVFGIYEDDSDEMAGFGMFITGSYFNHSASFASFPFHTQPD